MFYNISRTLEVLPYIDYIILGFTLLILEIKNFKEMVGDNPIADAGREGFIPPNGDGHEYFVSKNTIVYILNKAKRRYRVYLIQGEQPNVCLKHDRYGNYFNLRCENVGIAEKIIDNAFRGELKC
jgi:hypothetical protein